MWLGGSEEREAKKREKFGRRTLSVHLPAPKSGYDSHRYDSRIPFE